jgi:hypothetical protein
LNEKKLGAVIVLMVALIAPAMILTVYAENGFRPACTISARAALSIENLSINENAASLNVSLSIFACESTPINTVKLSNITQSNSPGVAVSVNGTYVDCTATPLFVIQSGDTAVVNMIVPYTNYPNMLSALHSANVTSITVLTDKAMYYKECSLNGGVNG